MKYAEIIYGSTPKECVRYKGTKFLGHTFDVKLLQKKSSKKHMIYSIRIEYVKAHTTLSLDKYDHST